MRVETIGDCRLILGDCLQVMPTLGKVDAVVTDPQYRLANDKKASTMGATAKRGKKYLKGIATIPKDWGILEGDDLPFNPSPFLGFSECILWGAIHYSDKLPCSAKWLIWDKRVGVAPDDNADCETAWTNLKGTARIHRQLWKGICRQGVENIAIQGDKLHPFQKPLALMRWCVEMIKPELIILDPFMGSGTTGVACVELGRKFIGVEIDEKYFDIACERISRAERQGDLFRKPVAQQEEAF